MQYKDMSEVDLKLTLLSGGTIDIDNLCVDPYILREIRDYGYTKYQENLQWVSLSVDDFINSIDDKEKKSFLEEQRKDLRAFDFYIKLGGTELFEALIKALGMIFRTDDVRVLNEGVIAVDFVKLGILVKNEEGNFEVNDDKLESLTEDEIKIVHRENFDDIIQVVKLQNYLEKPKAKVEEDFNPANDEVRKLKEHMEKMRAKVDKAKKQQREDNGDDREVDIADIISAVSSKSNSINKLNIWDFTLYQVYDEYARLELIDNYDFSIKAIMAGAEKIDLKHWSSRL
jgi:hypothetical protein